jgi:hypothetical protein
MEKPPPGTAARILFHFSPKLSPCVRLDSKSTSSSTTSRLTRLTQDGKRTGLLILNLEDASQMAEFAEPWFLALNAEAYWSPVMVPSDLQKAGLAIEKAVKSYG